MKKALILLLCLMIAFLAFASAQEASQKLMYADFEQVDKDKRPISSREGKIIFDAAAENAANRPKMVPRLLGPQGPLTQRLGFEFETMSPNNWAHASVKIIGMKDKGRLDDWAKTLLVKAEDLSSYKFLTLEIGAAGVDQVRIGLLSEGNGVDAGGANPEKYLNISSELKTHRLLLSEFVQPTGDWVKKKVTTEQVVKKLTGIQISVVKVPAKGFVVFDNVAFEKE
jgi:hypothetical protein